MPTALVVDNSITGQRLAGGLLERKGEMDVRYASDGAEALSVIESDPPDIVITDLMMPNVDGLELVAAVKQKYPHIPVILMTSKGTDETAILALKRGAASYVPRRRLTSDLVSIAKRVLAAAQRHHSHTRLMSTLSGTGTHFVLNNDRELIRAFVDFSQQEMIELNIGDPTDRIRIRVALEEALLNALYHGNLEVPSTLRSTSHAAYYDLARQRLEEDPYRGRRIFVDSTLTREEAVYVIRDEGPGFDPATIPDPTDPKHLEKPSGRGLLLMQVFMDQVTFNDSGNEVTLIKRANTELDADNSNR